MNIPQLPDSAPFSTEQRAWLNGFMAALVQGQMAAGGAAPAGMPAPAAAEPKAPVSILWGSQTGNSEGLAKKAAKKLTAEGFEPKVIDMGSYDFAQLPSEKNVLIITSTYGDGEAPDNAQPLHEALMASEEANLGDTNFAVFGLGDSEYPDFCQCSKDFDAQLEKLGAKRILDRIDCDVDFDDEFKDWIAALPGAIA